MSISLSGCNSVNVPPDTVELPEVPEKVVKMFNQKFPDATETTMRVVEKDKIWEADYRSGGSSFYVAMDYDSILTRHRFELAELPGNIRPFVSASTIKDATFSEFGEILQTWYSNVEQEYRIKYVLNERSYVMQWSTSGKYGRDGALVSYPFYKIADAYVSNGELPEKVRNYFDSEGLQIMESFTVAFINENNRKRYSITAQNADSDSWSFYFDHEGSLIFTGYKSPRIFQNDDSGLPDGVRAYLREMDTSQGFKLALGYECFGTGRFLMTLVRGYQETMEVLVSRNGEFIEKPLHYIYLR
ncbi:hypothetical protein [Dyadobacter crusticola]|uniref:hypothetical protein n=1 Tax=Dyadobacter crusticola TaxID=292407 RepID=UPI0012F95DF4|nr:hypothetical protein [Dyadobacter crusticola]